MFVANKSLAAAAMFSAALSLAACGTTPGERAASGGLLGAGAGAAIGKGAVIGGVAGAAAGVLTDPCEVNLGHPIWADQNATREDYYYRCGHYPPG